METTERMKGTHIPFEIIIQIILRLPCKSLMRFRSVSKQWCSSIDDKCFVNKYNEKLRGTPNRPSYLVALYSSPKGRVKRLKFYDICDDGAYPHTKSFLVPKHYEKMLPSSCGLVCLHGLENRSVVVYNPMGGKATTLPDYPEPYYALSQRYARCNMLSFGFDPQSNKYKVVQLVRGSMAHKISGCYVLTVGHVESSWRRIEASIYCKGSCISLHDPAFCVDGVLYWEVDAYNIDFLQIVAFDLNNEQFRIINVALPFPKADLTHTGSFSRGLMVMQEKLCSARVVTQSETGLLHMHISELKQYSEGNTEWVHLYELELQPKSYMQLIPMYFPLCIRSDWILVMDYNQIKFGNYDSALYSYNIKAKLQRNYMNYNGHVSKIISDGLRSGRVIVCDEALAILN